MPEDSTDYKQLLEFMLHELRTLQEMLDSNATQLSLACRGEQLDEPRIRAHVPIVMEELYALHTWLSVADFYVDPDQFAREKQRRINLYSIFYKAKVNLARRTKGKNLDVMLTGDGEHFVLAHRVVGIVAYVLLDNAIKYSPPSGAIDIVITEFGAEHSVLVTSTGPAVDDDELSRLREAGVRGRRARQLTRQGNGLGLALLDAICTYHGGRLVLQSKQLGFDLNGIRQGIFQAEIRFPKA